MKKVSVLVLLALAVTFAAGRIALSERAAVALLSDLDRKLMSGESDAICASLHEDVEVDITTQVGGERTNVDGGHDEFCAFLEQGAAGMALLRGQMTMSVTRRDFTVERNWREPWTARYTYLESSSMSMPAAGVSMNSESEAAITLVLTFGGVKLRKFVSEQLSGG